MVKTIREIIDMMEDAADNDDFGGLYAAAKEIKDASLREEVESAIAEYEESNTPVDETYSIVTSDYLDYYMYEDNTENLTEGKKITEGIDDKVYEVADRIAKSIQESGVDRLSMEELNEMISNSCEELDVKEYDDLEADVRGILSYRGYETDFETGEIIALEESIDVEHAKKWAKNMDKAKEKGEFDIDHASAEGAAYSDKKTEGKKKLSPEDEEHFNNEIDKVARQEIEDKLKNDKKEPDEEIEKELDNIKESKKEERIETKELVSFQEIDDMMYNATDYADLYEASSYIENNSLRVDVENLIGQCEDDGDEVEVAYSIVTSDLLDMYSNDENVAELKVMNKVTEGADTLDNSDEEDLATLLFTEAFEGCSIDKDGKADYYELQTLEEIQDWYDESVTEELYNKAKRIVEKVLNEVKFYNDSESHTAYIELNDNHTLWEIEIPEDINSDEFDMMYSDIVSKAAEDFKEETGTSLFLVGRMGRHACVEANLQNALRYNELKEVQEKLEKEVIEKANAYLNGEGLDESKKITEGKSDYSEMLSFATQLASALKSKGFKVKVNGEDNYVNINPVRDGAEMGVMVYLGEEDGEFGFEENTIGLGGDTISDNTVYPIFKEGWDYEIGAPSGSPKVGEEVYAVFKETASTTVDEVVEVIEKSFDTEGPVNESKKITESKSIVDEFKDYCNDLGINPDKKSSINRFLGDYGKNYVSRDGVASFDTEMAKVEKELKAGLNK